MDIVTLLIGIAALLLGLKGFSAQGLPVSRTKRMTGTSARVVGILCMVIGFACMIVAVLPLLRQTR